MRVQIGTRGDLAASAGSRRQSGRLIGVSAFALWAMTACPALAQTSAAPVAAPLGASPAAVQEVIVTSLQRNLRLQDAPASITAFTPLTIERSNITRPIDFIAATPNLTAVEANNPGDLRITIRGDAQALNTDPPVAVVIDGVVLTGATGLNKDLLDVQQIEVLKGPQGALYGRNAIAGAINIVTRAPTDTLQGAARLSYGNGETAKAQFTVGGAIIPGRLLFSLSGNYTDSKGFYKNITRQDYVDPYNEKSGRLRVDWNVTDDLKVELSAFESRIQGGATQYTSQSQLTALQTVPGISGRVDANFAGAPFVSNVKDYSKVRDDLDSVRIDYKRPWGRITSITAFEREQNLFASDDYPYLKSVDTTQFNQREHDSISESLRFTSPEHRRVRYIVGAEYVHFRETPYLLAAVGIDPGGFVLNAEHPILGAGAPNRTTSFASDDIFSNAYAVYGDLDFDITQKLTLTLAGRYDDERKRTVDVASPTFSATSGLQRTGAYDKFQPKVDLSYKLGRDASIYATYAVGFKAGGFNGAQTFVRTDGAVPNAYPSERAENYEVGAKTQWLDRRLTINASAFYTDKYNSQLFQFIPAGALNAVTVIDKIEVKGGELEVIFKPSREWTFNGGLGIVDADITKDAANPTFVGNKAPYIPDVKGALSATYVHPLNDTTSLVGNIGYEHWGREFFDSRNSLEARRAPLDFVNGRVALEMQKWTVAFWAKNLTNNRYNSDVIVIIDAPGAFTQATYRAPPRTFGAEVSLKF